MFHVAHIITPTQLIKNFKAIAKYLNDLKEPILITQKNGAKLVLLTAERYEPMIYDYSDSHKIIPFLGEIVNRK